MILNKKLSLVKYVIFDVDGVIVTACQRASEAAIQKFGLKANIVQTFFKTKWPECVEGRVCLEELLLKELPNWGFSGSTKLDIFINLATIYRVTTLLVIQGRHRIGKERLAQNFPEYSKGMTYLFGMLTQKHLVVANLK